MDVENVKSTTLGTYLWEWWQERPLRTRRRGWLGFALFILFWVAGAVYARTAVAGLAGDFDAGKWVFAFFMGGFSFLWSLLKALGVVEESLDDPNLVYFAFVAIMPGLVSLAVLLLSRPPDALFLVQKLVEKMGRAQGRVRDKDLKETLAITEGIPVTQIEDGKKKVLLGLDIKKVEGHLSVIAPTRAGKSLHLTQTIINYPGPMLIVDPKAEQLKRTAAYRRQLGPVYCLPGNQMHLSAYFQHLRDRDAVQELHYHLIRPWMGTDPIFAEKSMALFNAVGMYAQAMRLNPLRLLLDLAESNPGAAMKTLLNHEASRRHMSVFLNDPDRKKLLDDRFVTSALGSFTTRMMGYQKHIDTIAPPDLSRRDLIIPPDWVSQNATIYITYDLTDLRAVGGVVSAMIAGMLRYQMRNNLQQKMLVAIDELPAIGLRNIADYLSTAGGYGISFLLYAQSVAQMKEIYGENGFKAILSNCVHQLYYPPADPETARYMSERYGVALKANPMQSSSRSRRQQQDKEGKAQTQTSNNQGVSWAWREGAALSPNEMLALPVGKVLAVIRADRQYVFIGDRLNPIPLFDKLPPPDGLHLPRPRYGRRQYTDWHALAAGLDPDLTPASGSRDVPEGADSAGAPPPDSERDDPPQGDESDDPETVLIS